MTPFSLASHRALKHQFVLALTCAFSMACTAIPSADIADEDFQAELKQSANRASAPLRLAIAPATVSVNGLGREGFDKASAVNTSIIEQQVLEKLSQAKLVQSQRILPRSSDSNVDTLFWESQDDVLFELDITSLETSFDSHNALWIPNMLIWGYSMVPAWFIPTDRYKLELQGRFQIRLLDRKEPLFTESVTVSTVGTFDEIDRGWRWFGLGAIVGSSLNNKGNWERITAKLFPSAASLLAQQISCRLSPALRKLVRDPNYETQSQRSLAVVVGLGEYQDSKIGAAQKAHRVGAKDYSRVLKAKYGDRYVKTLIDGEATLSRFEAVMKEQLSLARESDNVTVYFAGLTSKSDLLFYDANKQGQGRLPLTALSDLLKTVNANSKTVLLDVGFPDLKIGENELFKPLTQQSINVFTAQRTGRDWIVPAGYRRGLFTHYLISAIMPKGDIKKYKVWTLRELVSFVTLRVESASGFDKSTKQSPKAIFSSVEEIKKGR